MSEKLSDRLIERAEFEDQRVLKEAKAMGFVPEVYSGSQTGALLREAAAALRAVEGDGWQPIETAPEDAAVLVTFERGDIPDGQVSMPGVMVAYWDAYYAPGGHGYDGVGDGWTDAHSGEQCHLHYGNPTAWRPLPAAPLDAAGSAEGVEGE